MAATGGDTLREVAAGSGRWIGTAVDDRALREDPRYGPTVAAEFDAITREKAMKWANVHPDSDVWTFGPADEIMAFAARHALRVQMHVGVAAHPPGDEIRADVARLAALGLRVAITEMDVRAREAAGDGLAAQRDAYHEILGAGAAGCHGVSFWGLTDRYRWLAADAPLLPDDQYRRKPAYFGARDALRAWARE